MSDEWTDSDKQFAETYNLTPLLGRNPPTDEQIDNTQLTLETADLIAYSLLNPYTDPHEPTLKEQLQNNDLPAILWENTTDTHGILKFIEPESETDNTQYYFHATKSDMIYIMGLYYGLKNTWDNPTQSYSLPTDRTYWYILSYNSTIFSGKEANYFEGMIITNK